VPRTGVGWGAAGTAAGVTGRRLRLGLTVGVLGAVLSILASACATPAPDPLARRDVPAKESVDPVRPCTRGAVDAPPGDQPTPAGLNARFDAPTNTITLLAGENVSIAALSNAVSAPSALREVTPGEWLLAANIEVVGGASLRVAAPSVRWLKMTSGGGSFVSIKATGGGLEISGSCITSWDDSAQKVDEEYNDGRSFLLARDGATMTIDRAELRYLGSGDVESYGLSWRTEGTSGFITNSVVSHLYYGLYTYEVDGLRVQDNEFFDNVLYGIDPHTGSSNLVIERNVVHDNGKHGIILAEDCVDSIIRDNIVYNNKHHGIVMYLRSDRNLIEGNESFRNVAQGININESNGNTIRNNKVYDNTESGISVSQTSEDTVVEANQIRGNQQDGVRLASEVRRTSVRDNIVGENSRYGVYIDTSAEFTLSGNTIFGNRTGLAVTGAEAIEEGDNQLFDNSEADTRTR
jgi:parallel beta-helix repeat protein